MTATATDPNKLAATLEAETLERAGQITLTQAKARSWTAGSALVHGPGAMRLTAASATARRPAPSTRWSCK